MRRRAPQVDDVDDAIGSWAVLVEVYSDGRAQVIAAGAELNLEITSASLATVLSAVVQAAQRARGSALLCVVAPDGTSALVVTRDGQVVAAAPALAERDVAGILSDRPSRRASQALPSGPGRRRRRVVIGAMSVVERSISSWVGVGAGRARER